MKIEAIVLLDLYETSSKYKNEILLFDLENLFGHKIGFPNSLQ